MGNEISVLYSLPPQFCLNLNEKRLLVFIHLKHYFLQLFSFHYNAFTELPAPEILTIEPDETSVSVTWRKPTGLDQVSYLLTLLKDGEYLQTVSTESVRYNFSDLQTDTEYTIRVCTTLDNGDQSVPVHHTIHTGNSFHISITTSNSVEKYC